ncbi:hypothetical protein LMH87_003576 [Akanthomyces muscarius]|uniref:Uncharacterized protein n=1 Tax=Akanthomyces muscarius TaxID=2231603 RepID=A0A9W8UGR5_AKAMU|nr:hypothetical protein LMH87_003576 [Akanthomyces muscarius]KAJ4144703.1 hypothetical protein LMH87_003576 [Akanthomyces muscarius]
MTQLARYTCPCPPSSSLCGTAGGILLSTQTFLKAGGNFLLFGSTDYTLVKEENTVTPNMQFPNAANVKT